MKIDMMGSVASGKTTLARTLSEKYNIPFYEKDNIVWERTPNGDRQRIPEERDKLFSEIINRDNWIVEGSPRKSLQESFDKCDYIIILDIKTYIRVYRVMKRWLLQRAGKISYNSKPTFRFLMYNFKWIFEYNSMRKTLFEDLSKHRNKIHVFKNYDSAMQFFDNLDC